METNKFFSMYITTAVIKVGNKLAKFSVCTGIYITGTNPTENVISYILIQSLVRDGSANF